MILMSSRASRFGAPSQQMLQVPMDRQNQTAPDVPLDLVDGELLICTAFAALTLPRMNKVGGISSRRLPDCGTVFELDRPLMAISAGLRSLRGVLSLV